MGRIYSKDELDKIELMINEGYTIRSIAKEMGRTMSAISELIERQGYKYTKKRTKFSLEYVDKIREGVNNGKTMTMISNELNVPLNTVCNWAKKYGIEYERKRHNVVNEDLLSKVKEMANEGYSQSQIAKEIGVCQSTIGDWCSKYNLYQFKPCIDSSKRKYKQISQFTLNKVQTLIYKDYTYAQIGKIVGVSGSTIGTWVMKYDLDTKRKYTHLSLDTKLKISQMLEKGCKASEITKKLGVEPSDVNYIKQKMRKN